MRIKIRLTVFVILSLLVALLFAIWTWQRNQIMANELLSLVDEVKKAPRKIRPYCNLASALNARKSYKESLKNIEAASGLGELNSACLGTAGVAYQNLGRNEEAVVAFTEALKKDSSCVRCLQLMVLSLLRLRRYAEAKTRLLELGEQVEENATLLSMLGLADSHLREFGLAKKHLERALELEPTHSLALEGMIWVELNLNNRGAAESYLETFIQHHPDQLSAVQRFRTWFEEK